MAKANQADLEIATSHDAAVRTLSAQLAAFLNQCDYGAVAAMYAEDAILLPPGSAAIGGRQRIEAFWRDAAEVLDHVSGETRDVEVVGDAFAVERGVLSLTRRDAPARVTGKFLVTWKLTSSGWRISRDIWNLDA